MNYPFISICTPTFNRRPFFNSIINCYLNQNYDRDKMEWIIIDDGTDKIEDLVIHIPGVKYFKYDTKMTLGKKRNLMHEKCSGEIIIYMDDDDYYPCCRVSHAVDILLKNPDAMCAGSSEMYIYFKHIWTMYKFGPYGPNHATAATFAFRRELLKLTSYDDKASLAEEKHFLKNYTIPFIQLDPLKSILVFSHIHNSFDKKMLLEQPPSQYMNKSDKTVDEFIEDIAVKQFFLEDIDALLTTYEPGNPKYKPDVIFQMNALTQQMNARQKEFEKENYQNIQNQYKHKIKELTDENNVLRQKNVYLENKISQLIKSKIEERCKIK